MEYDHYFCDNYLYLKFCLQSFLHNLRVRLEINWSNFWESYKRHHTYKTFSKEHHWWYTINILTLELEHIDRITNKPVKHLELFLNFTNFVRLSQNDFQCLVLNYVVLFSMRHTWLQDMQCWWRMLWVWGGQTTLIR